MEAERICQTGPGVPDLHRRAERHIVDIRCETSEVRGYTAGLQGVRGSGQ
jgi:hypothetical protein